MKGQKSLVAIFLFFCFCFYISTPVLAADVNSSESSVALTEDEVLLVAGYILNSTVTENDLLKDEKTTPNNLVPLYNETGDIVAFYVSFEPDGYAVINNNRSNPTVIEFGGGKNRLIEEELAQSTTSRIIYNSPVEIYSIDTEELALRVNSTPNTAKDIYSYYPELRVENNQAATQLSELKQFASSGISARSNGGYGFVAWSDMPGGSFSAGTIIGATETTWAITSDYSSFANNHCGAVAITNMALYYAHVGYTNLKIQDVDTTFSAVYNIPGVTDGPLASLTYGTQQHFSNCGYTAVVSELGIASFSNIIDAMGRNHTVAVLLANALNDWHWVICVGYRRYTSGANYMRIVNGWDNTTRFFYSPNSGSLVMSVTEYSVGG